MKLFILVILSLFLFACSFSPSKYPLSNQDQEGKIHILSSHKLKLPNKNNLAFAGVSDLAWDQNQKILYAITDRGNLFHLKLDYRHKKIEGVSVLAAYPLKNKQGQPLQGLMGDAEGLDLHYDAKQQTVLSISFEQYPRIVQYTNKGKWLTKKSLPKNLQDIKQYRHPNLALESLVNHPKYGLITAAEKSLKQHDEKQQYLYSLSGKQWQFKASSAKNSAITALEVLPNGNILVLERAWSGLIHPLVINLSEIMINNCMEGKICPSNNLAKLSTADGWRLDNFEGLTHFNNRQYLMVSDDNARPIQNTLLVLFEIEK